MQRRRKQASHSAVDGNSLTAQVQEHKHLNMKQYRFSECFPSLVTLSAFLMGAAEPGLKFSPSQTKTVQNGRGALAWAPLTSLFLHAESHGSSVLNQRCSGAEEPREVNVVPCDILF